MFFIGLFLGMAAGLILMGTVAAIGYADRIEEDYMAGYDQGFYDGMQMRGDQYGKEFKA